MVKGCVHIDTKLEYNPTQTIIESESNMCLIKYDPNPTPLDPSDEGDSKDRKTHLRETERQLRERNQQKREEEREETNPSIQRTIAHTITCP